MNAIAQRPRPGRPTREQAVRRHEELLDRALEMFLEKGFEQVTLDAIAAALGMTKRTMYARYRDKRALFEACVQRAIERWILPLEQLLAAERSDLEATLIEVARIRLLNAISPAGLRLQRIIYAESYRFPGIQTQAYDQGGKAAIDFLSDLFRRHIADGTAQVEEPELAATSFLSMTVGPLIRDIVWGASYDEARTEERIRKCTRLFVRGVLPR